GGAAVVLQLADGFLDVGQGAVGQALFGPTEVDAGVPAAAEFLDRADVDHAVVQVGVQGGHVAGEEAAVGGDGVAGQRGGSGGGGVLLDVVHDLLLCLLHGDHGAAH